MKNYYLFNFRGLLVLGALLLTTAIQVYAQTKVVTGVIKDAELGDALPGVNVLIQGTQTGTVSDFDGRYSISIPSDETVLVFSFVGYQSKETTVGSRSNIDVSMDYDVSALNEIVVIGYGEVEKKDATGSIVALGSKDFNKGAISTPQELIVGKVPGVVVTTGGGAAGTGSTIRIRGGSSLRANNDPLIVVDGMPLESSGISGMANPLATINPNDIETFTVLKDASATAIYGSRASNGVIIITTKSGGGDKLKFSYNGNVSIGVPVKTLDVYSGDEYRALIQDRITNHGLTDVADNTLGTANTNWQDEIYQNAISTDHNLSVSGGGEILPYRVSVGYTNQDGILKKNNMERTSLNVLLTPSLLNDNLKLSINAKGSIIENDFSNPDAIGAAVQFDPTQPIKNGNTRYGGYTAWTTDPNDINSLPITIATSNPVAQLEYRDNKATGKRMILGGKAEYRLPFVDGLKATVNVGYDYFNSVGHDVMDTLASWSYREPSNQVKKYEQTKENSLLDFYLNYNKGLESIDSKIDLTGGYSYQHFYNEGFSSNRPVAMTDGVFEGANRDDYKNEYYLISFFGRLNYTFKGRYLLTGTVRQDGSSRFGEDNRWGLFPSVAFAWQIKEESFLRDVDALETLKLRVGWGQTGQQDIGDTYYPYIPTYTGSQTGAYYQFGNSFYPTQRPNAYDANIKWETTTTQNIGLDFGFLDGRISGSVDVYHRETEDLINEIPIAAGTNFNNFLVTNVGSLVNQGVEVALTGAIISTPDLTWELSGNLTYNENEITKMTLVDDPSYTGAPTGGISGGENNNIQINSVGRPINTFYMFEQIYDQNGMPIEGLYVDKTGNGGNVSGDNLNKYYLQNPAPEYLIGISSRVNYKGFDFSFSGRLNLNNYVYNNNASNLGIYQNLYNQAGYNANILTDVEKTQFMTAQYWSDFYLENASFFRMDNITLGYSFEKFFTDKVNGRISFTVQNAFVITDYTGLDPEVSGGIDNNLYPRPRTYMVGLNLNF
ncbi:SusC/RagA family TonB-linked outer membrane protein [Reichenbachiella agariperforans]|uniref:Iron complex outermembrane recepter protein n=1 Tax=Reichenbachiella agariperforans TaxID=156994 RepID=A0A1M6L007_REIAG|nr:SusC/RagA family TonB-linked outer membrane protein [Reichenbachiella agariperforans]MBU2913739.1 SusC/RagA family TonB-linked outer membrane protein [Reichenbachiella agariperforans]SHJ64553.1 iron complex outermembrane recepter protein [Reichenbachiella agariperforans]